MGEKLLQSDRKIGREELFIYMHRLNTSQEARQGDHREGHQEDRPEDQKVVEDGVSGHLGDRSEALDLVDRTRMDHVNQNLDKIVLEVLRSQILGGHSFPRHWEVDTIQQEQLSHQFYQIHFFYAVFILYIRAPFGFPYCIA